MKSVRAFKRLSTKIYTAFLLAACVPLITAGVIGIYLSLNSLRHETLQHLEQEVGSRAAGMSHFFDQLSSELLYLSSSSVLLQAIDTMQDGRLNDRLRRSLERDYASFARTYPYIYQIRLLDTNGKELVRVDRRGDEVLTLADSELQDKSDRYYVREGLARAPGQVYVSALDLNMEHGKAESPERPVVRFITPIADGRGKISGLLIINLHASYILQQVQEMASGRGGIAYLFDRSGYYLSRSANVDVPGLFSMKPIETLAPLFPSQLLSRMTGTARGTDALRESIVAYAPIPIGQSLPVRQEDTTAWSVALSLPQNRLFDSIFNLYLLYGVLALSLLVAAAGGFMLSRLMLRPLMMLRAETEEIAKGNFSRRAEIKGDDEIADLATSFNSMAAELEKSYQVLENRRTELESEVKKQTADLERERSQLAAIIANTVDGIISVSPTGVFELVNGAARRYLAGPDGTLVGRSVREFWAGWDD